MFILIILLIVLIGLHEPLFLGVLHVGIANAVNWYFFDLSAHLRAHLVCVCLDKYLLRTHAKKKIYIYVYLYLYLY